MSNLKKAGRIALAELVYSGSIFVAWGTGDGSWSTPPAENTNQTGLLNEVGRHTATTKSFLTPTVGGPVSVDGATYSASATPTNILYVTVNFEAANASTSVIREIGIYTGTVVNPALPVGQKYFLPADLVSSGRAIMTQNVAPIFRSLSTGESFAFVITF